MTETYRDEKTLPFGCKAFFCAALAIIVLAIMLHFSVRYDTYENMQRHSVFLRDSYSEYTIEVLNSDFEQTRQAINYRIDEAFEPVYHGISKMADVHYSVKGQYLELMSGYFEEKVAEIMLQGLDQRLEQADQIVQAVYYQELTAKTSKFMRENDPGLFSSKRGAVKQMLDIAVDDAKRRFTTPEMIVARTATLGIGAAGGVYTYRQLRAILRHTGKRTAGAGLSVAKGASVGFASAGPKGALIGAGVGLAVAWFGTDVAVIKIDEHLNRQAFEAELRAIVDSYRDEVKKAMMQQVDNANMELARITPRELIQGKH
ncbi:hypothetical protein [Desulfonatronovibrio magnus]|uniref:hypothetical protein n=1 Tax=Desulfonatronovibrio magnus TaxID=698827 RepID=UPI0005EBD011|nr:hypothetical protein [Desulfonatronovibrio magnus]